MGWSNDATLGSGLPDRFKLKVTSARIKTPEGWSNDVVMLEGEQNEDGEISEGDLRLSVGSFEAGDKDGTFLVHETQQPDIFDTRAERIKKINKNSGYGRFLNSVFEVEGGKEALEGNQSPDRAKYEIWDLLFWEGLEIDVEMVERSFVYQAGHPKAGQPGTTRDAFVRGITGASGGSASAAPAAASSNGAVDEAKATEIAKGSETYMKYLEAFAAAGGDTNSPAASKAFYESVAK